MNCGRIAQVARFNDFTGWMGAILELFGGPILALKPGEPVLVA